ncbi:MAG: MFS transporter [bacterium]|nr:MFS transporter [bacterium]
MTTTISERKLTYSDVLRNRNFALLWVGQSVSIIGDMIYFLAINWFILEKTGSALQIGGNVIFSVTSSMIFSSVAGVVADRWDRRWIMIFSDLIRGFILILFLSSILFGIFNLWFIYFITFALTAVSSFFSPSYQSLIPNILKKDELMIGRSLNVSSSNLLRATATAFSGVMIAFAGTQIAILINAVSFFFSAILLAFIKPPQSIQGTKTNKLTFAAFFQDTASGWMYIRSMPVLISLFILFASTDFGAAFTWPVHALFAEKALGGGPELYGYLSTASLLGAFAGGYFIGRYNKWFKQRPGQSFALAAFIWGCLSIAFSQSTSIPIALGLRFVIGWSLSMIHVPIFALLDATVSDEFRGRVWATLGIGSMVSGSIATFLSGIIADKSSPRLSYLIAGLILVLAALLAVLLKPIRSAQIAKEE